MSTIDLDDLKAFITILNTGSISKAAEDLGLTQPALSLKLKKMESELGVKLFQRTSRNVLPFESALTLEGKVRELLSKFDVLKETLASSISELKGPVKVGCVMGWFEILCAPLASKTSEKARDIQLRMTSSQTHELLPLVARGKLDMAIVAKPFEHADNIDEQHLLDEELVLVSTNLPQAKDGEKLRTELLKRSWVCLAVPDPLVEKYWHAEISSTASFPWDEVHVSATLDHIQAIPSVLHSMPGTLAVLPKQIMDAHPHRKDFQVSEAVSSRNGLFLIWKTGGLELKRYQVIRDMLLQQVKWYVDTHS